MFTIFAKNHGCNNHGRDFCFSIGFALNYLEKYKRRYNRFIMRYKPQKIRNFAP